MMQNNRKLSLSSTDSDDVFGRIPYASLIALVLCWVGVILFCVMSYQAVNTSAEQARRLLYSEMLWLDQLQLIFVILGVVMILFTLALCIVGFMSTGATRKRTFRGVAAQLGGRVSCAICLFLTYISYICWLVILSVTVAACAAYIVFVGVCQSTNTSSDSGQCINMTIFRPILPETNSNSRLILCGGDVQQFCALTETASTWYYVSYFAAIILLLGIVHFMICLAANYARIETNRKTHELYEIWQLETQQPTRTTIVPPVSSQGGMYGNAGQPTPIYRPNVNNGVQQVYGSSSPLHMSQHPAQRGLIKPVGRY